MRSAFVFILPIIVFVSCNNAKRDKQNNNGVSTSLVNNPYTANGVDTGAMNAKPTMDFKDTLHDFGKINEGERVEYDFDFVNNGKSPLIISQATGSCGCTVADYPQNPVPPGTAATIKVKFDSHGKSGFEEKSVAITTNSKQGVHTLYIKAEIQTKN